MVAEIVGDIGSSHSLDRRGRAAEPRRSWASAQPFVRRPTVFNAPEALAGSWRQVRSYYRAEAVACDSVAVGLVATPVLLNLYGSSAETFATIAAGIVGFVVATAILGGYRSGVLGKLAAETQVLVKAGLSVIVLLVALSYMLKADVSRFLVFVAVPLAVVVAVAARAALRGTLRRSRHRGLAMMRTLVVGDVPGVAEVVREICLETDHGYDVVGVCLPSIDDAAFVEGVPLVGAVSDVPQVVVDRSVDVVIVAGSFLSGNGLRRLSWALDRAGAQLIVAPALVDVNAPRLAVRPTAGLSFLEVEVGATMARRFGKAALDRVLGSLMLLVAAPVILVAGVAIRLSSPGPMFYRQTRIGVDGKAFTMWKLRTMFIDSDARRAELLAASEGNGVLFKIRSDPRVTPVGRVLRKYSLDELPQLFNVVVGDMSLVGPRPPLAEEVAVYEDAVHRRLRVRPGLTGLWQVSGRSDLSWDESVRLDLRYVDNWSLTMDLLILWRTGRAVFGGSGAY